MKKIILLLLCSFSLFAKADILPLGIDTTGVPGYQTTNINGAGITNIQSTNISGIFSNIVITNSTFGGKNIVTNRIAVWVNNSLSNGPSGTDGQTIVYDAATAGGFKSTNFPASGTSFIGDPLIFITNSGGVTFPPTLAITNETHVGTNYFTGNSNTFTGTNWNLGPQYYPSNANYGTNSFVITNGISGIMPGTNGSLIFIASTAGGTTSNKLILTGNNFIIPATTASASISMGGNNISMGNGSVTGATSVSTSGNMTSTAGGFGSKSVLAPAIIQPSGITNAYAVNACAYITCTALSFTNFNSASTAVLTNTTATYNNQLFILQPGGSIVAPNAGGLSGVIIPF